MPLFYRLVAILILFVLALAADLGLLVWLQNRSGRGTDSASLRSGDVLIFGRFSPALTWLRRSYPQILERFHRLAHDLPVAIRGAATTGNRVQTSEAAGAAAVPLRQAALEWAFLALAVIAFCSSILDLSDNRQLPGNEAEIFQSLDWTLYNSLHLYHQFPLWNPYLRTGQPYIADPMTHVFNPLASLPVLAFGVLKGFKLALLLSYLAAAVGMWRLGVALGMGRMARLWVSLMYVFAGQPAARFFQGQYLFIFGFAWIPWCLGSLFLAERTRRRFHMGMAALSLALLFFSGAEDYSLYMLLAAVLFALVMLPQLRQQSPFIRLDTRLLAQLGGIGLLALGLAAIQWIPQAEFAPRLQKGDGLAGVHTPLQILLDFTSQDTLRPGLYVDLPTREEAYAYIGLSPLLALIFLPFALKSGKTRPVLFFALLLALGFAWTSLPRLPGGAALLDTPVFLQFRHLLRILIFGSLSILLLAGLGLDALWRWLMSNLHARNQHESGADQQAKFSIFLAYLSLGLLGIFMLRSAWDVYQTNRPFLTTQEKYAPSYAVMRWLQWYEPSNTTYVRVNPNNAMHDAVISSNLNFIDAWYPFNDIRAYSTGSGLRPVEARPNYIVQSVNDPQPEQTHERIQEVEGYAVYRLPQSLPFAFSVSNAFLAEGAGSGELKASDVTPLLAYRSGPDRLEMIANGAPGESLVALITHYPGWQLKVDGQKQPLKNLDGYLAADLLPGVHQYVFSFQPVSFYLGLLISLLCAGLTAFLMASDLQLDWRESLPRLPAWRAQTGALLRERLSGFSITGLLSLEVVFFCLALLVYGITRLSALDRFPIYFFADEASQALYAEQLLLHHFRDATGSLLPVYVLAANDRWTPLLPMYIHALTLSLFGKSIFVTRGTSAVISILAAISTGLILKKIFKARYWWAGVLLLAITPAWLLHSRTAFETVMTTSFYACFLLFYLLYRERSPRYLYPAIVMGAATFYTYSNAQLIIVAAAGLLFLSDLRYHLRNWRTLLPGALLGAALAWPLISFTLKEPGAFGLHLHTINSYWYQAIPLQQKIWTYLQKYTFALSPQYLFFPNSVDLPRHRMDGMGLFLAWTLPLVAAGLLVCLWKFRSHAHRSVILAALAVPVGASLADIGITRVLALVIPLNILAALGLNWLLERLKNRVRYSLLALPVFGALALASIVLFEIALVKSPLWFSDYGLYGMQYGARQLFVDAIPQILEQQPDTQILVTSVWANGSDEFIRFFLNKDQQKHVRMDGVDAYLFRKKPLSLNDLFIMTPAEYHKALESQKFSRVKVERILPYPDGTPGFYFVRLAYGANVDAIFNAEKEARKVLASGQAQIDGQMADLQYSQIDMGVPQFMFDGDHSTLMRGLEANPFILEITFAQPRSLSGLEADFGLTDLRLNAVLYGEAGEAPATYQARRVNDSGDPILRLSFNRGPKRVNKIHFEFLNPTSGEAANIHIRELKFLP